MKFTCGNNPLAVSEIVPNSNFLISPNPTHGPFIISCTEKRSEIKVYNALGQLIREQKIFSYKDVVDLSDKPKGVYFVQMLSGKGTSTQKIIME